MVLEEHGTYRRFKAGDVIFRAGDDSSELYVVDSGSVEIVNTSGDNEIQLSVLGPEEIFGEMALFAGAPRSATARAAEDCAVRMIDEDDLSKLVPDPLARRLLKVLSERLAEVDSKLGELGASSEASSRPMDVLQDFRSRYG